MTDSNERSDSHLPAELALALRNATSTTLDALHSLRTAVWNYVQNERARGATLAEIHRGLGTMIETASLGDGGGPPADPEALTKQVLTWSAAFYRPKE